MSDALAINRRTALATVGLSGLGASLLAAAAHAADDNRPAGVSPLGWNAAKGEYELPPLPYAYDALEPHIDEQTMRIHHDKHHAGYVKGLNNALAKLAEARNAGDASLVKHWSQELAFHGSGHVNHTLFWHCMTPPGNGAGARPPEGPLASAIDQAFGSFDNFAWQFKAAAKSVEGSGWAWLCYEPLSRSLIITQREKQQNTDVLGSIPLLGVDVWEHAYYLKYQNRRADYVEAFMNLINWNFVARLHNRATTT